MKNKKKKRVLIIREGSFGYLILTLPVFFSFIKNGYIVDVCCKSLFKNFLKKYIGINEVYGIDTAEFGFFFIPEIEKLRKFLTNYEIIIAYCDEKEIIGKNIKKNYQGILFFQPVQRDNLKIHITDYLLKPIKKILPIVEDIYRIKLEEYKPEFFLIHPGSGSKHKNWEKEKFLRLSKKLKNVKLLLGPAEKEEVSFWQENYDGEIIINPSLENLIEIVRNTHIYIGNDSGITHFFSIFDVKIIAIFGPTSPYIWGPRGENVKIIYKKLKCSPCKYEIMKNCNEKKCLKEIDVEDVYANIQSLKGSRYGKTNYF